MNARTWEKYPHFANQLTTWRTSLRTTAKVKRSKAPTSLYSNSVSTFHQTIKLIHDVELNPGPQSSSDRGPSVRKANKVKIASHPGPGSLSLDSSQKSSVKCLVLNARSLKSFHKTTTGNKTISNLQRFQDLVYADDSDVVCVKETWLNEEISNSELLHDGYIIYRKDRDTRHTGGVLIAVKTNSFKSVKKFLPSSDEQLQQLEIMSTELTTASDQKIL